MMIKGRSKGRCLWFATEEDAQASLDLLVVLLVYKKETQEVPDRVLKTARERLRNYREEK